MSKLTEQELLLLDNFMYMPNADSSLNQPMRCVIESAITAIESGVKPGGEMSEQEALDILKEMKHSDNIMNLVIARTDPVVHAACFVDPGAPGEATVAFQGTGGTYDAWKDNVQGAADPDTNLQERALAFVKGKCADFSDLTLTGHSKGGNLAMYVTVKAGDRVGRCVSFDGQGFNDRFLKDNAPEISRAKGKIKSICGDNDYVNGMLKSIAGETIYISGAGKDFYGYHKSYDLYAAAEFSGGSFSSACITQQGPIGRCADRLTDGLYAILGETMTGVEFKACIGVIASLVGAWFSRNSEPGAWMKDMSLLPDMILVILNYKKIGKKLNDALRSVIAGNIFLIGEALDEASKNIARKKGVWRSKYKDERPGKWKGIVRAGGLASGAQHIVYKPNTLDVCSAAVKRLAWGLQDGASDLSNVASTCGSASHCRVGKEKLHLQLARVKAADIAEGDLQHVLHAYARALQAYSAALGALSRRIAQADEMLDDADREIIGLVRQAAGISGSAW